MLTDSTIQRPARSNAAFNLKITPNSPQVENDAILSVEGIVYVGPGIVHSSTLRDKILLFRCDSGHEDYFFSIAFFFFICIRFYLLSSSHAEEFFVVQTFVKG